MPVNPNRSSFRLDRLGTAYDASLGSGAMGDAFSVVKIVDDSTLGTDLITEWQAHPVERNAGNTMWVLGGSGLTWRLRYAQTVLGDFTYWPLDGLFPATTQITIGEEKRDIDSFQDFGEEFNSGVSFRYNDKPTIEADGDAVFDSGRQDGFYAQLLARSIRQQVTFSATVLQLDSAIAPPSDLPALAAVGSSDALNLQLTNPREFWLQVISESSFPTTSPEGLEASLVNLDRTMTIATRLQIPANSAIRYNDQLWGVESVSEIGDRGRFWQVELRRRTTGVSV